MKNEGLKRGLQSIDSTDYQMGENMTGVISLHYNLDKDPISKLWLEHCVLFQNYEKWAFCFCLVIFCKFIPVSFSYCLSFFYLPKNAKNLL